VTAIIAIYSPEQSVGATTLAVNLGWCAAQAGRRTLLWDFASDRGASRLLGRGPAGAPNPPAPFATHTAGLDLLAAPPEPERLATLAGAYDRILLDGGIALDGEAVPLLRAAAAILVPLPVSETAGADLAAAVAALDAAKARRAPLLPVFMRADRRRASHRAALALRADWPMVPHAGAINATAGSGTALGSIAPRSPATRAFAALWQGVDRRIAARP
jgi:cellulose biosynthesis protein BcsQ